MKGTSKQGTLNGNLRLSASRKEMLKENLRKNHVGQYCNHLKNAHRVGNIHIQVSTLSHRLFIFQFFLHVYMFEKLLVTLLTFGFFVMA